MMVLKRMRGENDVGEDAGRKGFHFVVLVGLLEALIAAKREQDYYYGLQYPSEWEALSTEYFFFYFSFFFFLFIHSLLFFDWKFLL